MNCPVDNETLAITERQGIEIDYCPKCRGVWLDRGELDKLIERSTEWMPERDDRDRDRDPDRDRDRDRGYGEKGYGEKGYGGKDVKRKKKSIFSELFEFGD